MAVLPLRLFRNVRFEVLTPGIFQTQIIYDRKTRRLIRVRARDDVDFNVIRQIFASNDYGLEKLSRGQEIVDHYSRLVAAGERPLIIDCGANSGMSLRFFSETFPAAHIVAIEPDAENIVLAKENAGSANVTYIQGGIASTDSRGELRDPGNGNWAYQVETNPGGALELVSLNTLLRQASERGETPFLVKIDIEGFEENLFQENVEWIDRFPVLVIELHDWMLPRQANARNFLKAISARDRDFVYHGENVFSISNRI